MDDAPKSLTPQEVFGDIPDESIKKKKLIAKALFLGSIVIVIIMGIIFLISLLWNSNGSFTVRVGDLNNGQSSAGISLSETQGFSNPTVKLSGIPMDKMDNITYDWLPFDILDTQPGSNNGENYICYTYFVKNSSDIIQDLDISYVILESTKNVDSAIRFMVYQDGVPRIFAKAKEDGSTEAFPENIENFESETVIENTIVENVKPGQQIRFTVVIWLEGEDSDCIDTIKKGTMQIEVVVMATPKDE